jgi:hypothetical protein
MLGAPTVTADNPHERALALFEQFLECARLARDSSVEVSRVTSSRSNGTEGSYGDRTDPQIYSPPAGEQSIIVDASLVDQPDAAGADGVLAVGQFIREMQVLIKYGHAQQVPSEIERWIRTFPRDLVAHYRLAEFELQEIGRNAGVDRLCDLVQRALSLSDLDVARSALSRALRESPHDSRLAELRRRVGAL